MDAVATEHVESLDERVSPHIASIKSILENPGLKLVVAPASLVKIGSLGRGAFAAVDLAWYTGAPGAKTKVGRSWFVQPDSAASARSHNKTICRSL